MKKLFCLFLFSLFFITPSIATAQHKEGEERLIKFANFALACVHKEYPNKISHTLNNDGDIKAPHELTPAFYGCYDWHSSVHGHWLLARLAGDYQGRVEEPAFVRPAIAALQKSITPQNIATEIAYFESPGRKSFERPYGLAWALQLDKELRNSASPELLALAPIYAPLAQKARNQIIAWLPNLRYPVRSGEHSQTAFALGLALDWANNANDIEFRNLIIARARAFYLNDKNCPINYEPSGEDFLSPCLAEAALMARVLPRAEFSRWLSAFLPQIPRNTSSGWLPIGIVTDRSDPKLAHIDGLNLSRAWMLHQIAASLPEWDKRTIPITSTAEAHANATLPAITGEHYEGGHWLGTFAVYLLSGEGL